MKPTLGGRSPGVRRAAQFPISSHTVSARMLDTRAISTDAHNPPGLGASLADPGGPAPTLARKSVTELVVELIPRSIGEAFSQNNLAQLVLLTAVPRGGRMDFLVQKCCELGVARIVLVIAARSVARSLFRPSGHALYHR